MKRFVLTWAFCLVLSVPATADADCGCGCGAVVPCDAAPAECDETGCDASRPCPPSCGVEATLSCDQTSGCKSVDLPSICDEMTAPGCEACCDSACPLTCDSDAKIPSGCSGTPSCQCIQCCSGWRFTAEVLFLRRADASGERLLTSQNTGATLLDARNLEFDHEVVPRFNLIREYCNCWGWDINYFGTDQWNSSSQNDPGMSPILIGPGLPFGSTAPGTVFRVDSSTELHSLELNLRRRVHNCVTMIAGFRWMELDDRLRGRAIAPTAQDYYTLDTTNHLYGFQIGADANLLTRQQFQLNSIARVGILGNHIDHHAQTPLATANNGLVSSVQAEADETAMVAEIGLRGVVPISSRLSVYGGYQVLWLDGVALAPQQLSNTSLVAPGSATVDAGSTLLMHGATVGLQASF